MTDRVPITKKQLESLKTPRGGWPAEAIYSLGLSFPLAKGWKERLIRDGAPAGCQWALTKGSTERKPTAPSNAKPIVQHKPSVSNKPPLVFGSKVRGGDMAQLIEELQLRSRSLEIYASSLQVRIAALERATNANAEGG